MSETARATALRQAAVQATHAPSVHNSQPWRFVVRGAGLEVHADRHRRLAVLDPRGRQLVMSCGCALLNARVAVAAAGWRAVVDRFPDPARPDLVARMTVEPDESERSSPLAALAAAVDLRRTNRRAFTADPVPAGLEDAMVAAAAAEAATLVVVASPAQRSVVADLSERAQLVEEADPAYRAELRAWTAGYARRLDGLARPDETAGSRGWLEAYRSGDAQSLVLLGTAEDTPAAWLRAGEAMERVLLEATRSGCAAAPLTQAVELAETNAALRHDLGLVVHPQVLLRVGVAAAPEASRRRRLVEVLSEVP